MKFSLSNYGGRCVVGAVVFYLFCLLYGSSLTGADADLHHSIFEMIPGFTWINLGSTVLGAIEIFFFAWIFAAYMVWMLNSSMEHGNR